MAERTDDRADHPDLPDPPDPADDPGSAGRAGPDRDRPPAGEAGSRGAGDAPDTPAELGGRGWWRRLKRTVREFQQDNLTDWAAALTYYGLLVLVSVLGLLGHSVIQPLIDKMGTIAPGPVGEILKAARSGRPCRSAWA